MKARQKWRAGIAFFGFLMFPVIINFLSPVLILAGASEGIVNGSFILFILLFLSSLFFGRAWCGWLCPAAGMQQSCAVFRYKKAKTGWGNILRLVIWFVWLGFIVYFFIKAGGIHTVDALYESEGVISILNPVMVFIYLGVIMLVFIMMLIWGNRAFCKYICWMAPFMMVGNRVRYWLKIPGLHLKPVKENCIECGRCTKQCPMGIDVQAMVLADDCYNSECIMCLGCVDICPKSAIVTK